MVFFFLLTIDSNLKLLHIEMLLHIWIKTIVNFSELLKKVNRKVQSTCMQRSQTAANPRHQEEEKKVKNIHAQNQQTYVQEAQRSAPSSPSEVISMLNQTEKRGQRAREDFQTLSAP